LLVCTILLIGSHVYRRTNNYINQITVGLLPGPFILSYSVSVFSFPYFSFLRHALD